MPRITIEEINELCEQSLPWALMMGFEIAEIGKGTCRVRLPRRDDFLRPGGTVNGPVLMGLADYGMYVAVLSRIGRVEMAVTTSLNCNFLRRPKPGAVIAECRLIKLGKRLAYGEVSLYSEGAEADGPVAHVTATYSIPPEREGD
ncbi:MAG: PaaI family thioesterase [Alphaproteobacteria bacterium]